MEKLPEKWVAIGETGYEVGITPEYAEGYVRLWIRKPGYLPEKLSLVARSVNVLDWCEAIWEGLERLLFDESSNVMKETVETLLKEG